MIGYNRTVKLQWLDETLDLFLAGMTDPEIYEALRERLKGELSIGSTAARGSREKTITLLLKTWVRVPPHLRALRDDGIEILHGTRRSQRLPLHWGITMAVYPFWRVVADVTGRLFRLQGTATPMQVQRRVKELLGEREVVARSTRYVLRAFADWGVIVDSPRNGEYHPAPPLPVVDSKVTVWLMETTVVSDPDGVSDFRGLINAPCLFPFQLNRLVPEQLAASGRLEVVRHNLEEALVRLRKRPAIAKASANTLW
jgi:DNA-binding transcriptional ArsR family regulator